MSGGPWTGPISGGSSDLPGVVMPMVGPESESIATFSVPLRVSIRPCMREALPQLEWFGLYTPHREIIGEAFDRQGRGENLMLVAEVNGFPVGQVWIDL